jgi:heme exporter protein A
LTPTPLLEIRNLSCERDERRLFAQLDLSVFPGDLIQIVGPNGAGKTTLLRVLTGISNDYEGDILWRDRTIRHQRHEFLSDLLYIGHHTGIKKSLTPAENLAFYSRLGSGFKDSVETLLCAVGLFGYEDVPCYQLSAGQQRRVALARLFGSRARLWILDEPFTAVDKAGVAALEQRLSAHLEEGGSIILTTHQALNMPRVRELDLTEYTGVAA